MFSFSHIFFYSHIKDYSWREYIGAIPPDALVAARDEAGQNIYIAQAYLDTGLVVGEIHEGDLEIYVPAPRNLTTPNYFVTMVDKYIKVSTFIITLNVL